MVALICKCHIAAVVIAYIHILLLVLVKESFSSFTVCVRNTNTLTRLQSLRAGAGPGPVLTQTKIKMSSDMLYPSLVVFDLDMCVWSPEMYTLSDLPTTEFRGPLIKGDEESEGVISVLSGGDQIKLFPDARKVLQEFYQNKYPGMRLAIASSADTPRAVEIGKAALNMLEVLPGVTVREAFAKGWPEGFEGNIQIGRTAPLSEDKSKSHFPRIQEATKIPYDEMLFFDDCNWGDHCTKVAARCPGVVTQRTPRGLQYSEFILGLKSYNRAKSTV